MKQFGKILRFELKNYFHNKLFVGVTIFLVVVIAVALSFPRIMEAFQSETNTSEKQRPVMLVSGSEAKNIPEIEQAFSAAFTDYDVRIANDGANGIKKDILSGDAECAFLIHDLTSYTYYVQNLSMYDTNQTIGEEVLQNIYRVHTLTQKGIPLSEVGDILNAKIEGKTEAFGKDQFSNFFYTYIMIFALYMVIIIYGQMIATNVASEKNSRAMELLITSARPVSMMFGKVIASCIAGFVQILAVFGSSLVFFKLNEAYWNGNNIISSIFDMPVDLLAYMLLFFVLGFFLYAFMYGAVGSTASKLEDINTSVMPITLLFVISFFVVMFSMTSGNLDSTLMKVSSYIPFTAPMAMFTRIAMSTVAPYEIVISVVILMVSIVLIGWISAKIYRIGVLLYGTTPKIGNIIKMMRKDK